MGDEAEHYKSKDLEHVSKQLQFDEQFSAIKQLADETESAQSVTNASLRAELSAEKEQEMEYASKQFHFNEAFSEMKQLAGERGDALTESKQAFENAQNTLSLENAKLREELSTQKDEAEHYKSKELEHVSEQLQFDEQFSAMKQLADETESAQSVTNASLRAELSAEKEQEMEYASKQFHFNEAFSEMKQLAGERGDALTESKQAFENAQN